MYGTKRKDSHNCQRESFLLFVFSMSDVLFAFQLVVPLLEEGLEHGSSLHVEIEEVNDKGHDEEDSAGNCQLQQDGQQHIQDFLLEFLFHIGSFLLPYQASSSGICSRDGSSGSSRMTVRM